ncbi:hypothetical protein [Streptomyces sp. DH20]|uniref:hypothetical protein n=1 Tax=Streptomyces sp. DH20 TaxID=2857009 RepID=UPI001E344995|nr:hypothetical protein [Streptomyces sp. DH20]
MSHRSAGPACGNNPHHRMSDGDRQAVDSFRAYLATVHRLDRIRDAARLHRQQLLGTSELYAVIEADDEPEPAAVSAAVAPPGDRAVLRERIAEETALSLGRDLLREGLGAFLLRLVGPENARRVLAEAAAVPAAVAPRTDQTAALCTTLREVLDTFSPMKDTHDGPVAYYDGSAEIEPEQFDRWRAVLDDATRRVADETATEQCECGCGQPGELVHGRRLAIPESAAGARQDGDQQP